MQSKIAHAAERKAFSVALDQIIKAGSSDDREEKLSKLLDMAANLLKDTAPAVSRGLRQGLQPGSKWEQFLWRVIDETDPYVLKTVVLNAGYEGAFRGLRNTTTNAEKYQCNVPWIILFDPTSACNKHCIGCWAGDYGNRLNLTYDEMDDLMNQGVELGVHLWMMTGGEPLVRKKDIIKLAEAHSDCAFNIFTNGSLIDQQFCDDCKRVGNIVFSISLEGTEESNDGRRGEGSYQEVMRAMDLLHKNGLLFGTSTAYTRDNTEIVSSDEYFDTIIEKGARWAWYFHYMPVGEGASVDLLPTVEQRTYMFHRIREVRGWEGGKQIFAMDFQNDGEYVGGCIAGGRVYCHINARGDVEPCVFIHYSNANIRDKSLIECLQQPLFQQYRENYKFNDNMLQPCPMLENPDILPKMVHAADAYSTEYVAPEDVDDLAARNTPYAQSWATRAEELWLEMYPTGKKTYADKLSSEGVDVKAKLIAESDAEAMEEFNKEHLEAAESESEEELVSADK